MTLAKLKVKAREIFVRFFACVCRDSRPKVVFYHDVGKMYTLMGTDENVFWQHWACLREGDVVCFDDGFRGVWDARKKIKREMRGRRKVIVFLAVELVGKPGYLNWDEIRILQEQYGFEFQCHTWSHQTLIGPYNPEVPVPSDGRTDDWYRHELVDSKAELERQLGKSVAALCLPVRYFSDDVLRRCREAGYEKVYASYSGNLTNDYLQPRCLVQDLSVSAFRAVLNGGLNPLQSYYLRRHKIV